MYKITKHKIIYQFLIYSEINLRKSALNVKKIIHIQMYTCLLHQI